MRSALVAFGFILVISGIAAIMNPRAIAIPHHAEWRGIFRRSGGTVEIVSEEGCIVYGALSVCLGIGAIWGASVKGPDVPRNDRSIAQSILIVRRGLDERYGRMENCSAPQIERAARELRIPKKHMSYLFAAFMGRAELDSLRERMPEIGWNEVVDRIERITFELPYGDLSGAHFHESWRSGNES
jgi:hypothetical protein